MRLIISLIILHQLCKMIFPLKQLKCGHRKAAGSNKRQALYLAELRPVNWAAHCDKGQVEAGTMYTQEGN